MRKFEIWKKESEAGVAPFAIVELFNDKTGERRFTGYRFTTYELAEAWLLRGLPELEEPTDEDRYGPLGQW